MQLAATFAAVGCLVAGASAFSVPSGVGVSSVSFGRKISHSSTSIQMGFFDAIGKAINDSMSNDEKLGKKQNPGFRDGYDGPRKASVLFRPSGKSVESYGGERLGDVCRKAGVPIMFGCQKGTCGTCEVMLVNAEGQREKVRVCEGIVPKNAPGTGTMSYQIELSDSKVVLKRQLDWEQVKDKK